MSTSKKPYKSSIERTQLKRILEDQELKQPRKNGDNIASLLRRRALLPNPGLGLKGTKGWLSSKKTMTPKSTLGNGTSTPPALMQQKSKIPPRAQSVQNISRIPSAHQGALRVAGSTNRRKCTDDSIKRASSVQDVATVNLGLKSSKQNLSSKAVAYNAELLLKFDEEKKVLEAKISELTETSLEKAAKLEDLERELERERDKHRRGIDSNEELRNKVQRVEAENTALKRQLDESGVSIEHFTDSEKLFIVGNNNPNLALESSDNVGMSSEDLSAVARTYISFARDDSADSNLDRHNSMSVDRGLNAMSIADLTVRFLQMQEAQDSTNEELQATLQELMDLQDNVNGLNEENEDLRKDSNILLESLCRTTEKLENARIQVENLKALLIRDIERCGNNVDERELHLTGLLKCAQQEKEELLLKEMEYLRVLSSLESESREARDALAVAKDSVHLEEEKNKKLTDENYGLKHQLEILKRSNGGEFSDERDGPSFSVFEMDKLLRQKEAEVEELKRTNFEATRDLRQQNDFLKEKIYLQSQHNKELDKDFKSAVASLRLSRAELGGCKKNLFEEREEWAQFQSDLLTAVVVANNLNMEKDNELKKIRSEKTSLHEKYEALIEHVSSKGLLEIPLATLEHATVSDDDKESMLLSKAGDFKVEGIGAFIHSALSPATVDDLINRNSKDLFSSTAKGSGSHLLPADHPLLSPLKKNLPSQGATSASNGVGMDEDATASRIPGILVKIMKEDKTSDKTSASSTSFLSQSLKSDPLAGLAKQYGGSKRSALLTWCQKKLEAYDGIEITNFSSSWNDGLALCTLLSTYLPRSIPYSDLKNLNVKQKFQCAFRAAKEAGLELGSEDDLTDLMATDRPAWQMVYALVTNIYKHFEVDDTPSSDSRRNSLAQR